MPDAPQVDTIDRRDMAAQYGWALSVLKGNPELSKKFDQAVKQGWEPARFVAEIRGTKWFQHHSEAARNAYILRTTDPKTWAARTNQMRASVRDMAAGMGAQISEGELARISKNVLTYGWNDAQIKDTLAGAVKMGAKGTYGGGAAANAEQLRTLARRNGVEIGDGTLRSWLVRIASGESISGFEAYVRQMAASAFPSWAEHVQSGMDLQDAVEPYRQSMARVLELNENDLDLFDPTIRKTLQATDKDGRPQSKPLWQFEKELRNDKRFLKTKQAQDSAGAVTRGVLQDFGLI